MMQRCKDHDCSNPSKCKCRLKKTIPFIWIIGGPGCGKRTQCAKIAEKYHFNHIRISDLLKSEIASGSIRGGAIETIIKEGKLAPDDDVLHLTEIAVYKSINKDYEGILFDNFPGTTNQGTIFEKYIAPVDAIIYFDCSDDIMMQRVHHRMTQTRIKSHSDDEEIRKMKHNEFRSNITEILTEFKDKIQTINADRSSDEVFADVQNLIEEIISSK